MAISNHTPKLSDQEWSSVAEALREANACGCSETTVSGRESLTARIRQVLFGKPARNTLADPRLEAIRRFACTTFQRRAPSPELAAELASHGLSRAQVDAIALLSI